MGSHVVRGAALALAALAVVGCTTTVAGTPAPIGRSGGGLAPGGAAPPAAGATEDGLRAAGQAYVEAVNAGDAAAATALLCSRSGPGAMFEVAVTSPDDEWLVGEVQVFGGRGGIVDILIVGGSPEFAVPLGLTYDGERWCVDV
ncbi:hypothetical protein BJF78_34775 [Pseudonocardia sp. CNS-139]|nr:hypothetical protein BJF78_34775 [Pseudonocardia sp. CNS-139]